MIQIVRFQPTHLQGFTLQAAQAFMQGQIESPGYTKTLADGQAFTLISDGVPMFCAGLIPIWSGRALAWALVHKDAGKHMRHIVRGVRGFLDSAEPKRIEALVDDGFTQGVHFMQILGFKEEGLMRSFNENGSDCRLFSRVK